MKNHYSLLITLLIAFFAVNLQAQLVNVNPDKDGEPWIAGGLRQLTGEDMEMLNALPALTTPLSLQNRELPDMIDNSEQAYFRSVFSQEGGSCGQASGIGYNFTYEIDYIRDIHANTNENTYPTHYTWNFLNNGNGGGSWYFDGWQIIKANGCPNIADYGGHFAYGGPTRWMSGYDEYFNGMANRIYKIYSIDVSTAEGLNTYKQWCYDHLNGSDVGGVTCFAAGVSDVFNLTTLPFGTPEGGKSVITKWGTNVNHAMTFVGYNDSIRYDFNNDGFYTNDQDINEDGEIDMKDWEIGGVKMVNSWGLSFGDYGKSYVMYKLLAETVDDGGIWGNILHVIDAKPEYFPILTLKATIKHTSRNKIKILAGVSNDLMSEKPQTVKEYPMFSYQGGDYYMQGGYSQADKTIEIGLDITSLLSEINSGDEARYFLQIVEQYQFNSGEGEIISFSIIDYSNGVEEVVCQQQNIPINNNDTTYLFVNKEVVFDKVEITDNSLPQAILNEPYSYQLSAEGGTQPYIWDIVIDYNEEISTETFPEISDEQLIPTDNDDGYVSKEIEFDFPFYGTIYNKLTLLTDGAIVFEENFTSIRNTQNIISNRSIAAYCADLMIYPSQGDGIWYSGDENSATFRWRTSKYDEPQVDIDIAVELFANGEIHFYYNDGITPLTDWAAGISNGGGSSYLIPAISGSVNIPADYHTMLTGSDFPYTMTLTQDGVFSGIISETGKSWDITFKTTDYSDIYATKTLIFTTESVGTDDILTNNSLPLIQNIPNPFRTHTTIAFELEQKSNISVEIFNVNGVKINSLLKNESYEKGKYSIVWNAENENGTKIVPGIYYCKLVIGKKHFVKKMIFIGN